MKYSKKLVASMIKDDFDANQYDELRFQLFKNLNKDSYEKAKLDLNLYFSEYLKKKYLFGLSEHYAPFLFKMSMDKSYIQTEYNYKKESELLYELIKNDLIDKK